MKSRLVLDQWCNAANLPEYLRESVQPVAQFGRVDWRLPAGTIFEGPQALFMCRTGQCEPIDDECMQALGMDADNRAAIQLNYRMSDLGINSKEDRELYRAGVILGYDPKTLQYIPGPKWAEYQAAKLKLAEQREEDV